MLPNIFKSVAYGAVITLIYLISANIMYYTFNGQSMFHDIFQYEWVEYMVVAGALIILTSLIEFVRYTINKK